VRTTLCVTFASLCLGSLTLAATKQERPDQEMLKLMDVLQQWEMIKNLALMRDLSRVEAGTERSATGSTPDTSERRKGKVK
jgi:hypothetical protein